MNSCKGIERHLKAELAKKEPESFPKTKFVENGTNERILTIELKGK